MRLTAFDLGLKTTGVSHGDTYFALHAPTQLSRSPMTGERRQGRFGWWEETFRYELEDRQPDMVVVEAPFIHPRNVSGAVDLIMLHGVLRAVCARLELPVASVDNRVLKKWVTGHGNAPKEDMVLAAQFWKVDEGIVDHNVADAVLLWHYHMEAGDASESA